MQEIRIPFPVVEQLYNNREIREKDAVLLESLQRIANALENINEKLNSDSKASKKKLNHEKVVGVFVDNSIPNCISFTTNYIGNYIIFDYYGIIHNEYV